MSFWPLTWSRCVNFPWRRSRNEQIFILSQIASVPQRVPAKSHNMNDGGRSMNPMTFADGIACKCVPKLQVAHSHTVLWVFVLRVKKAARSRVLRNWAKRRPAVRRAPCIYISTIFCCCLLYVIHTQMGPPVTFFVISGAASVFRVAHNFIQHAWIGSFKIFKSSLTLHSPKCLQTHTPANTFLLWGMNFWAFISNWEQIPNILHTKIISL